MTFTYVDAQGLTVATDDHSWTRAVLACQLAVAYVYPGGDIDADGQPEARIWFIVLDTQDVYDSFLTVRARDGAELDRSRAGDMGGAVDGRGDDRLSVSATDRVVRFEVLRGENLARLLVAEHAIRARLVGRQAYALPATGARCLDVVVGSATTEGGVLQLLASNGRPWWTLRYCRGDSVGAIEPGLGARARC